MKRIFGGLLAVSLLDKDWHKEYFGFVNSNTGKGFFLGLYFFYIKNKRISIFAARNGTRNGLGNSKWFIFGMALIIAAIGVFLIVCGVKMVTFIKTI